MHTLNGARLVFGMGTVGDKSDENGKQKFCHKSSVYGLEAPAYHSLRSASITCNFSARRAGPSPLRTPVTKIATKDTTNAKGLKTHSNLRSLITLDPM